MYLLIQVQFGNKNGLFQLLVSPFITTVNLRNKTIEVLHTASMAGCLADTSFGINIEFSNYIIQFSIMYPK